VGCAAVDIRSLDFGTDAAYQNVAEYIAAIAAVRGAHLLRRQGLLVDGQRPSGVWLRGDSKTALSWMEKGRVKSELAVNASMVAVMQTISVNMPFLGQNHVPAEKNPISDELSRTAQKGRTVDDLVRDLPELQGVPILSLDMAEIIPLCDPHKQITSDGDFSSFWSRVRAVLPL
jgi:hypothetical protein